jgi:hypothetical protein
MLLLSLLLLSSCLCAQNSQPPNHDFPEQAYVSPTRYVNAYFGFSFELPPEARLSPVSQQASRDGNIPLLNLQGPPPADAVVLITAVPIATGKGDDAKVLLRQDLDQELYRGVEEIHGLSKTSLSGHQFYFFETRRGIEQHMLLAFTMGDYIVRVVLAAHDEKLLKRMEDAFRHIEFFAPASAREHLTADAKPYDGPTVSSHRLAVLEEDPPSTHIDAGNINGDFYENAMLGFSYRIPQGWSIEPNGAVQSAVESYRAKQDLGRPRMGRVERRLVDACSRTLFSAWAKRPDTNGQVSYDDFGEVTVTAMSAACFPTIKFPEDANNRESVKDFLAQYSLTHPVIEDMREAKVFKQQGMVFLFLEGTVAFQVPDDELSRRLSLGMAITQRRGYLLTWFFAAPHDAELRALTDQRASFDKGSDVTLATTTQPGGGVSRESVAPPTPSNPPAAQSPRADTTAASSAISSTQAGATPSGQPPSSSDHAAQPLSRPSLLRPGENMSDQQVKGAPIGKTRSR